MIERIRTLVRAGEDFAFETTCSGRQHSVWLDECKREGWRVTLLFLWLSSPEMAIARVAQRISEGGHAIPPEVIRRRYVGGIRNMLRLYLPLADDASVYDNSDGELTLIAERFAGTDLIVRDIGRWAKIEEAGE